eukprot:15345049-Ditylum_brightwellii.AAC.1
MGRNYISVTSSEYWLKDWLLRGLTRLPHSNPTSLQKAYVALPLLQSEDCILHMADTLHCLQLTGR